MVLQAGGEKLNGVMISFEGKGKLELGILNMATVYCIHCFFLGGLKRNRILHNQMVIESIFKLCKRDEEIGVTIPEPAKAKILQVNSTKEILIEIILRDGII